MVRICTKRTELLRKDDQIYFTPRLFDSFFEYSEQESPAANSIVQRIERKTIRKNFSGNHFPKLARHLGQRNFDSNQKRLGMESVFDEQLLFRTVFGTESE